MGFLRFVLIMTVLSAVGAIAMTIFEPERRGVGEFVLIIIISMISVFWWLVWEISKSVVAPSYLDDNSYHGDVVYACTVSSVCDAWIESLHRTKRGAYFACRKVLVDEHNKSHESRAMIGKSPYDFMPRLKVRAAKIEVHN